ncbi:hypothetical protein ACKVWC_011352 [Pyricularia oryzae]
MLFEISSTELDDLIQVAADTMQRGPGEGDHVPSDTAMQVEEQKFLSPPQKRPGMQVYRTTLGMSGPSSGPS